MREQVEMLRAKLAATGADRVAWCGEHGDVNPDMCVEGTSGDWLHFTDPDRTRLCTSSALIILERNPDAPRDGEAGHAAREPLALACAECETVYTADGDPAALARLKFPLDCWVCHGAVLPR